MAKNTDNNGGGSQDPDSQLPPGPQLPEPPVPTTLGGPLGVRWRALGGVRWRTVANRCRIREKS